MYGRWFTRNARTEVWRPIRTAGHVKVRTNSAVTYYHEVLIPPQSARLAVIGAFPRATTVSVQVDYALATGSASYGPIILTGGAEKQSP